MNDRTSGGRLSLPVAATCLLPLLLFLLLGTHQLSLPGLHYDEAKEAGVNAMQLLTGQPLTPFRDAALQIGPWRLPLMVQDYIGALNPLAAIPFLAVGGLDIAAPHRAVVALRWLPVLIGGLTLCLTWAVAYRLGGRIAALVAASLLAVSPAFVFWSRQGIFVTNLTSLFFMACLLTGIHWWQQRRPRALYLTALFCGLGLYAKLLFAWALVALVVLAIGAWLAHRRGSMQAATARVGDVPPRTGGIATSVPGKRQPLRTTQLSVFYTAPSALFVFRPWLVAACCFLLPLVPLFLFNLQTGGTLSSIFGNLGHSYYGVNNRAYLANLATRIDQFAALLRGDFFWYLGEVHADPYAGPAFVSLLVAAAVAWAVARRAVQPAAPFVLPVALLALIVAQSAFTVSDLFITHYSLLLPLVPLAAGMATTAVWRSLIPAAPGEAADLRLPHASSGSRSRAGFRRLLFVPILGALLLWGVSDLRVSLDYHRTLALSGGIGGHSDAIGNLAAFLARSAPAAPLALDWGLDAPIRFLTLGQVNPIEVFGYASMEEPDDGFGDRVKPFLANPDNVYLAHATDSTVFRGRVKALTRQASKRGLLLYQDAVFRERSGRPLFIVYRTRVK